METQKEYYYTYYSYEEWGRGYFGSRGCKCLPEEDVKYFGSFKDKTFKPTQKIILKSNYTTRAEADADEVLLHDYFKVDINPHFANQAKQTSTKFRLPKEKAIEIGRRNGKINGNKLKELKIGVCGLSAEQRKENGKKYGSKGGKIIGNIHKENKTGIFSLTKEQRKENGKKYGSKGGKKIVELGLGIHGLTKEQRSQNSKKYGKIGASITNSQKWMCTETGYITNSGALTNYQKARGIDISNRKRIE